MTQTYRIITVCTGNICRSPMAELMLRHAVGSTADIVVDSAGTTSWEQGNPIDPRAASVLISHGLADGIDHGASFDDGNKVHHARQISSHDFVENDLILAMDTDHFDWLREHAPSAATRAKVRLLREFDPAAEPGELGIADPWYGGIEDFEEAYRLIDAVIPGVLEHLGAADPRHHV
ncbi:low molecular weight phosphotyrosine protein phosphatase [Renibacterium salmoninarum ATCC 33209]|uniref:protein-tyrosine-phosphatase n=1 Tax=Renibacterium salmoninarum (strain ATCC 33209 / DSM 20767 / JCM 11484 / NBRC 15589 / NCIMB 2235) TaxID=288705 RepID=A9WNX1_RENSM|nr:low molecular weight protein-tyrosine-phosphatase [Renibacterium salmoninarum]ABY22766.1 low molecular weight phosphotyrosine protein phosphatase [Renibacterium salmoninarum ATCC 33209]